MKLNHDALPALIALFLIGFGVLIYFAIPKTEAHDINVEKPDKRNRFDPYWEQFKGPNHHQKKDNDSPTWFRTKTAKGWIVSAPGQNPFYVPDYKHEWLDGE